MARLSIAETAFVAAADNGQPRMMFSRDWDMFDVAVRLQAAHERNLRYYCVTVHGKEMRLSKSSMYCFKEDGYPMFARFRYRAVWITEWKVFERCIYAIILANCLTLAHPVAYDPTYAGTASSQAMEVFNLVSNLIFLVECVLKIVARGVFLSDAPDPPYLREATNLLDLFVVATGMMEVLAQGATGLDTKQAVIFRIFRVLRALRTMSAMPELKNIVTALLESGWRILQWMALIFLLFVAFVILGNSLFGTAVWQRCRLTESPVLGNNGTGMFWPVDPDQLRLCGGNYQCQPTQQGAPTFCRSLVDVEKGAVLEPWSELEDDAVSDFGYTGFQTIESALLTVFQVSTMEGWTVVLQRYRDAAGELATVFFSVLLLFAGLVLMNLVVAILWERIDLMQRAARRAAVPLRRKFDTRPKIPQDIMDMRLTNLINEVTAMQEEQRLTADFRKLDTVEKSSGLKNICYSIIANPRFNMVMMVVISINAIALSTDCHPPLNPLLVDIVGLINYLCTFAFMIEVALKICGMGVNFFTDDFNVFDLILVLVSSIELLGLQGESAMAALRTARLLRLFKMVRMQVSMRVLFSVLVQATVPSYNFCLIMLLCVYCFSLVGLQLLYSAEPIEGYFLGFGDISQALVTVTTLLATDDWFTNMLVFCRNTDSSRIAFVFFVVALIVCHYIFMNLFFAIFVSAFAQARDQLVNDMRMQMCELRLNAASEAAQKANVNAAGKNHHVSDGDEAPESPRWPPGVSPVQEDAPKRCNVNMQMNILLMLHRKRQAALRQSERGGDISLQIGHVSTMMRDNGHAHDSGHDVETDAKAPAQLVTSPQHARMPPADTEPVATPIGSCHGASDDATTTEAGNSARSSDALAARFARPSFREHFKRARSHLSDSDSSSARRGVDSGQSSAKSVFAPRADSEMDESVAYLQPTDPARAQLAPHFARQRADASMPRKAPRIPALPTSNVAARVRDVLEHSGPDAVLQARFAAAELADPSADSVWRAKCGTANVDVEAPARKAVDQMRCLSVGTHFAPVPTAAMNVANSKDLNSSERQQGTSKSGSTVGTELFLALNVSELTKDSSPGSKSKGITRESLRPKAVCRAIARSRFFEPLAIFLIVLASVALALEHPYQRPDSMVIKIISPMNVVFVVAFTLEMAIKCCAWGAWEYSVDRTGEPVEKPYFRVGWNWIDFVGVVSGILDFVMAYVDMKQGSWKVIKAVRLLRVMRMLRLAKTNRGMRIIIDCLIAAIPTITNLVFIALLIYFGFAVLFVNLMKGSMMFCSLDPAGDLRPDIDTREDCLAAGGDWVNPDANFDHVGNSMLTLLHVGTGEGWIDVMVACSAARGIDLAPRPNFSPFMGVTVICFVLLTNFFLLNLFIGVLVDQYGVSKNEFDSQDVMSTIDRRWKMLQNDTLLSIDFWRSSRWRVMKGSNLKRFMDSQGFEVFMQLLSAGSVVPFLIDQPWQDMDDRMLARNLAVAFGILFALEAWLRLVAYGWSMVKDPMQIVDTFVALGLLTSALVDRYAREAGKGALGILLRLFVLGRVMRLSRALRFMRIMGWLVWNLLLGLMNVAGLLLLLLFMYSCLGVGLFGTMAHGSHLTPTTNFETAPAAMLLLFGASTGEKWHLLMYEVMGDRPGCTNEAQDIDELLRDGPNGCGSPVLGIFFFVSFILAIRVVVMNLIIAIILDGFTYVDDIDSIAQIAKQVNQLRMLWRKSDPQLDGRLPLDTVVNILQEIDEPVGVGGAKRRAALTAMRTLPISDKQQVLIHDLVLFCAKRVYLWLIGGYPSDVSSVRIDPDVLRRWEADRKDRSSSNSHSRDYLVAHAIIANQIGNHWRVKQRLRQEQWQQEQARLENEPNFAKLISSKSMKGKGKGKGKDKRGQEEEPDSPMSPLSPTGRKKRELEDRQWKMLMGSTESDWMREEQARLRESSPHFVRPLSPLPWPPDQASANAYVALETQ